MRTGAGVASALVHTPYGVVPGAPAGDVTGALFTAALFTAALFTAALFTAALFTGAPINRFGLYFEIGVYPHVWNEAIAYRIQGTPPR